jgi:Cys-tRNA(Pro)/Cys-tRNA(Cys) deacylase
MAASGTRALDALRRAGIAHTVHEYEIEANSGQRDQPAYGLAAATALHVDPERICKTLVATVDERLVCAVVPVAAELDMKKLADAAGGRRAAMADPAAAERATGYVRGGISPLGQRRTLPTVIDAGVVHWPTIFVSAGRRGLQVELDPADLIAATNATVAPIGRHPEPLPRG